MPNTASVINDGALLYVCCRGHVSVADFSNLNVDRLTQPDPKQQRSVLIDLEDVRSTDMVFANINALFGKLERHYKARSERLQLLIYAPNDLSFGMSRMLQSLSDESDILNIEIFQERQALNTHHTLAHIDVCTMSENSKSDFKRREG